MNLENEPTDFEKRAQAALRNSVDQLDGATRSRLAQARSHALAQREARSWFDFRYLAPAGAMAAAVLMTVLYLGRPDAPGGVNEAAGNALYDLELLADADAFELTQETDLEFIEWAAAMGEQDQAGT
jgi:hypothetical protein